MKEEEPAISISDPEASKKDHIKILYLDTETTGKDPNEAEILELAMIDEAGRTLYDRRFKPRFHESWPEAELINRISPRDVFDKDLIEDHLEEIQAIFDRSESIAGYNLCLFDLILLRKAGLEIEDQKIIDVMIEYAEHRKVWSEKHRGYRWFKLIDAAAEFGYSFRAHGALEDAKATRLVHEKLCSCAFGAK